jgi:hypothetical protein
VEKFVKVLFTSARKEERASEVRKVVERGPAWSWLLVGNSSYLNRDVGSRVMIPNFGKQILMSILWFAFL